MRPWRWLVALLTLLTGRLFRRRSSDGSGGDEERIVPEGPPERRAENLVLVLLGIAVLFAIGFVVTYAEFGVSKLPRTRYAHSSPRRPRQRLPRPAPESPPGAPRGAAGNRGDGA